MCGALAASLCLPVAAAPALAAGTDADRANAGNWSSLFEAVRPVQALDTNRMIVLFDAPSLAEWTRAGDGSLKPSSQRAFVKRALAEQDTQLAQLRAAGVQFTVQHRFVKVANGVSIDVHGDNAQLLHAVRGVAAVHQVRTTYPALQDAGAGPAAGTRPSLAAGVASDAAASAPAGRKAAATADAPAVVAVLDTGIDFNHPVLRGRQAGAGYDVLAKQPGVDVTAADEHGTQVAGGVTLGNADARILPVRVLESTPVIGGLEAVVGTNDALLAGFEFAVDPDRDGSTDDHASVALAAVSVPYAGFADGPEEVAVDGAEALGVLTVAAAGNDGPSGDAAGTIGAPASARAALAVGAADLRVEAPLVDLHVRGGLLDTAITEAPLLTLEQGLPSTDAPVVAVEGAGSDVVDFLGEDVRSRVEGAVALVRRHDDVLVADQVRAAADAGAVALLVEGAGSTSIAGVVKASGADIPAIGIGAEAGAAIRAAAGETGVTVSFDARAKASNRAYESVAGFSAAGPRHDGIGKPDLLAPGVAVSTTGAGTGAAGRERYSIVSGTSIAAARVAGQAAAIRAAHGNWSPATVRAAMLGTARPLGKSGDRPSVTSQGAGLVDAARAAGATTVARPARLDAGVVTPGQAARLPLQFVGTRAGVQLAMPALTVEAAAGGPTLALDGGDVVISTAADQAPGVYGGWLVADSLGIRVPWSIVVRGPEEFDVPMEGSVTATSFPPADGSGKPPSSFRLALGGSTAGGGLGLRAASRIEVRLVKRGKDRGTIGTMRNALPGVYTFGISGHDGAGKPLKAGKYELRVRYVSAATPGGAWREGPATRFTITGQL